MTTYRSNNSISAVALTISEEAKGLLRASVRFGADQNAACATSRTREHGMQMSAVNRTLDSVVFPRTAGIVKGFRTPAILRREGMHGGRRRKSLEGGNRGVVCAGGGVGYGDLMRGVDSSGRFRRGTLGE